MPTKLTHAFIKEQFEKRNCTLLTSDYTGCEQVLSYLCPNGCELKTQWCRFRRRELACLACEGRKLSHRAVSATYAKEGYTLLSTFQNSAAPMLYKCPKGHLRTATWSDFQTGRRCKICAGGVVFHQDVEYAFNKEGYTLHSIYRNALQKLKFTCPNGHKHSLKWPHFSRGVRCTKCSKHGFRPNKPANLYFLQFNTGAGPLYKIGVTGRTIEERYKDEPIDYKVLLDTPYLFGYLALSEEQRILKENKQWKYVGPKILLDGDSELFVKNVLQR